jgi:HEAT repeats
MLILGLLAGTAGREWYRQLSLSAPGRPVVTISAPAPITQQELEKIDLDGIRVEPQSDSADPKVELQLRSPKPRVMQGTPDDAEIRRVLAYVIGHSHQFDDGARLDSIDALRPKANDPQVRAAMSEALRHDPNPAVRLKAIEALRGSGSEPDVQSAILAALAGDDNSGVRIQALDTLFQQLGSGEPSSTPLDDQAVSVLRDRMRNDSNSYIRSRSADVLGRLASMEEDAPSSGGRHP